MRRLAAALLAASVAASLAAVHGGTAPAAPQAAPAKLVAVGDIASCDSDGDEATAALVARLRGTIAVLGDAVYERGTAEELERCYAPSWGRFLPRTRVALGNHEYGTGTADAAMRYFGLTRPWYAYRVGGWRVLALDSNCSRVGCAPGSAQWRWLRAQLAASSARCTLAYWHHPRWSSGFHGSDRTVAPLWTLLARAKADVVLAGHDHHYERFAPIDGIRSFVVGTGGRSRVPALLRVPGSRKLIWTTYGALQLTLRAGSYTWRFVSVDGRVRDSGTGRCR